MNVLVAFDGTEHSIFALDKAAELATGEDAEFTVLSVVLPEARGSKSGGHMDLKPHADKDVAFAQGYLDERGVRAATKIAHGEAADEIVREARAGNYDLIVVGTRELGAVTGRLLGSVSRKVTREAPCPVVVAGKSGATRVEPSAVTPV